MAPPPKNDEQVAADSAEGHVATVTSALRALAAMSVTAKLTALRRGFVPALLGRIDDLRTLVSTPSAAATTTPPSSGSSGGSARRGSSGTRKGGHPESRRPRPLSTARSGAYHPRGNGRSDGVTAVQRHEMIHPLVGALKLLCNLLAGCAEAKLACVSLQLPMLLLRLWPLGAHSEGVRTQILTLLCNYVGHCPAAKASLAAYSDAKGRCLATLVVKLVTKLPRPSQPPIPEAHWRVGWATLQALATTTESRAALMRAHLLAAAIPLLQRTLGATDEGRAAPVLDFLANLAFDLDGQAALMRTPEAFNTILEGLECRTPPARLAACLCLRNLAFSADGQAAILTKPRALPALLRALHPSDLELAARAAAALWALVGRCERAKAALKAAPTLNELKIAERALTAKTMVAPPPSDSARATLDECLRAVGAVMAILRL